MASEDLLVFFVQACPSFAVIIVAWYPVSWRHSRVSNEHVCQAHSVSMLIATWLLKGEE